LIEIQMCDEKHDYTLSHNIIMHEDIYMLL